MTFVGKILVIFQVVLSVFFMAFAVTVYNVQTDWKKNSDSYKGQVQTIQRALNDVNAEFDKYKTDTNAEIQKLSDRAEKAEAQNKSLQQDLELSEGNLKSTLVERDNARTDAQLASQEADARTQEALKQRAENAKLYAQNTNLRKRLNEEENKTFNLSIEKQEMIAKHNKTLEELATIKEIARANKYDINIASYKAKTAPAPELEGFVLDTVKTKRGLVDLVDISLGSNDGLAKGHVLSVYREKDAKYLGGIEIISVEPNRAIGSVIPGLKNGIIQRGDNVTTKL